MDPIGNMFTTIRNAVALKKEEVSIPHSKIKEEIAKVLKNKKVIIDCEVKDIGNNKKILNIKLKYFNYGSSKMSAISKIDRISKPGLRVTSSYNKLPKNLFGFFILSTSKGIISDDEAIKKKIGGEILGHIW